MNYKITSDTWKKAIDDWNGGNLPYMCHLIYHPTEIAKRDIEEYAFNTYGIILNIRNYVDYLKVVEFHSKIESYSD